MKLVHNILSTSGRPRVVQAQNSFTEYYLFNSAANLKAYSNNLTDFAYYGYNASNTRAYKLSMLNQNQWTNGQLVSLLFLCSPKEKKQKERAFAAVEKNPVHNARQLAERRYPLRSRRPSPLPCYGKRIFSVTPQVGEITTEYNANFYSNILPKYSFNAKELDEETGMYYYEARYYKPPVFTSRDAMFEKYFWMTPYAYCANNPVKYVDPDGEKIWIICEDGREIEYTSGMQYEGESDFQKQTIEALNYGYDNSPTAKKMIGELSDSKFEYKIKGGDDSGYDPSNSAVVQEYSSDEIFYEKGGGTIIWKTQGAYIFEKDPQSGLSTLVCRPTINLFHELGHAWDHMAGLLAADDMNFENLQVNEWTATRTENMIRKELNLPLRTYYRANKWEGKSNVSGPALLDLNGNHRYTKYQHQ